MNISRGEVSIKSGKKQIENHSHYHSRNMIAMLQSKVRRNDVKRKSDS